MPKVTFVIINSAKKPPKPAFGGIVVQIPGVWVVAMYENLSFPVESIFVISP